MGRMISLKRRSSANKEIQSGGKLSQKSKPWVILSIDDDPPVHELTRLLISDFVFEGRPLEIHFLNSGLEARSFMQQHGDVALLFLDVIMESDAAGLELARYIRDDLGNHFSRIVLRTGQSGQAPEEAVIREYDIDGYLAKTEMGPARMHSILYSMLRSYRDICSLQRNRLALSQVVESITSINSTDNLTSFASALLNQIAALMSGVQDAMLLERVKKSGLDSFCILASSGRFSSRLGECSIDSLEERVQERISDAIEHSESKQQDNFYIFYNQVSVGMECLLYIENSKEMSTAEIKLLDLFIYHVGLTHGSLLRKEKAVEGQRMLIRILGESIDTQPKESQAHQHRVGEICRLLAALSGMDREEVEMIARAAPLHDIGKSLIPNHIIDKSGKLDADEWSLMQHHTQLGYELLNRAESPTLRMAAAIAWQHHEQWDGQGYPQHLKGDDIELAARITLIADVFDSLCTDASYRNAVSEEEALNMIKDESGSRLIPHWLTSFLRTLPKWLISGYNTPL